MSIFKRNRKASDVPESSTPAITGATFGPWATHDHSNTGSMCSTCR